MVNPDATQGRVKSVHALVFGPNSVGYLSYLKCEKLVGNHQRPQASLNPCTPCLSLPDFCTEGTGVRTSLQNLSLWDRHPPSVPSGR